MVEIDIKEHYIFRTMLLAVANREEILIKHRDYPQCSLQLSEHVQVSPQGAQQHSAVRLTLSDIESLLGFPGALVSDSMKGGDCDTLGQ